MTRAVDGMIGAAWVLFWLGWLAAAGRAKSGRARWRRFAGVRLVLVVVVVVLLRAHRIRFRATHTPALQIPGLVLFAGGLALAIWARWHLGRNWGPPMTEKDDPELVMSGPYRWIRNPIYSGLILAMLGTTLAVTLGWLVPTVVVGGYFVYSALMEQRYLTHRLPQTYPAYRDRTKLLVPFVF